MGLKLRRLYVWVISLGAVLGIFLLYNRISETPEIDFDAGAGLSESVSESDAGEIGGKMGKVGEAGVGTARKAKFIDLDKKTKEVERIFGFEVLLHEEGDEWDVEKPYVDFFRPTFKCSVTAERGKVRVETVGKRHSPKEATFSGNVIVHILPKEESRFKESFIYLDDVTFVGGESQFSTGGPVKFVSEDAQMLGRGLELVYNNQVDRLEFLRIIHLESLRLKGSKTGLFGSVKTEADKGADADKPAEAVRPAAASSQAQTEQRDKPVADDGSEKGSASPPASAEAVEQKKGEYYRCVFSKDVVIDTPERFVFADDKISIENIFWAKSSSEGPSQTNAEGVDKGGTAEKTTKEGVTSVSGEADAAGADSVKSQDEPVAKLNKPEESSGQSCDVVVTCDNGILVTPMESVRSVEDFGRRQWKGASSGREVLRGFEDTGGRTQLVAKKINYCASTENTIVGGPLELTFDVNDPIVGGANETVVPVKVTARKEGRFFPALSQVVFVGDSTCTMVRADSNSEQRYILSGPRLTVDLSKYEGKQAFGTATEIEHLTASGGVVRLATTKTAGEELPGGIELKCRQFDYDTERQMLLATGPGVIKVDNSNISEPNSEAGGLSLKGPCWAFVRDFDTLKYFMDANQVIADAEPRGTLRVDYLPIVEGEVRYDRQVIATGVHLEALLCKTADGQSELSTLTVLGGVTYEDEDKEFAGSELFYDANDCIMTIDGDASWPCLLNGVPVDEIEYDLKTEEVKAKIVGPGALGTK